MVRGLIVAPRTLDRTQPVIGRHTKTSKTFTMSLDASSSTPYTTHMDTNPYDDTTEEMTREEAIAELMAEGYSRDEATRMIGDYEADEYQPKYLSDFPDEWSDDIADFIDPEDFE